MQYKYTYPNFIDQKMSLREFKELIWDPIANEQQISNEMLGPAESKALLHATVMKISK